jgi:hypothetical protein
VVTVQVQREKHLSRALLSLFDRERYTDININDSTTSSKDPFIDVIVIRQAIKEEQPTNNILDLLELFPLTGQSYDEYSRNIIHLALANCDCDDVLIIKLIDLYLMALQEKADRICYPLHHTLCNTQSEDVVDTVLLQEVQDSKGPNVLEILSNTTVTEATVQKENESEVSSSAIKLLSFVDRK